MEAIAETTKNKKIYRHERFCGSWCFTYISIAAAICTNTCTPSRIRLIMDVKLVKCMLFQCFTLRCLMFHASLFKCFCDLVAKIVIFFVRAMKICCKYVFFIFFAKMKHYFYVIKHIFQKKSSNFARFLLGIEGREYFCL